MRGVRFDEYAAHVVPPAVYHSTRPRTGCCDCIARSSLESRNIVGRAAREYDLPLPCQQKDILKKSTAQLGKAKYYVKFFLMY